MLDFTQDTRMSGSLSFAPERLMALHEIQQVKCTYNLEYRKSLDTIRGELEFSFSYPCSNSLEIFFYTGSLQLDVILLYSPKSLEQLDFSVDSYLVHNNQFDLEDFIDEQLAVFLPDALVGKEFQDPASYHNQVESPLKKQLAHLIDTYGSTKE